MSVTHVPSVTRGLGMPASGSTPVPTDVATKTTSIVANMNDERENARRREVIASNASAKT